MGTVWGRKVEEEHSQSCIESALGQKKSRTLLFFHSFIGRDTVSSFFNHPKKSAFMTWNSYPEIAGIFRVFATMPSEVTEDQLRMIERYVILMYEKTSSEQSVNKCRKDLFSNMSRQIENIPPTNATLLQHTKHANLQAGYVWAHSTVRTPYLPNPQDWGWARHSDNSLWEPLWADLSEASKACRELIKCCCKSSCRKGSWYSCARANLKCISLCLCSGECV